MASAIILTGLRALLQTTACFRVQFAPALVACRYVEDGKWQYHQIQDAGHWIPRDAPNELNELLIKFLKSTALSKL